MSRNTGQLLTEDDHIRQSVADILTTPIGSRVERRPYGSIIPDLIDHPYNAATRLRLMSATVIAIERWERRISITAVIVEQSAGKVIVEMQAVKRAGPRTVQPITLTQALR
jgi:phage baseplate assembly protein W